jgi:PAS domain S-box-containing protein
MQHIYKRFGITIGFLLLLILLIANVIITRRQLDVQTHDQTWAAHTQQVLFQVSQMQSLMANAEMGQRGFIYTGDSNYLAPYDLAITQLEPNIQQLARLTDDSPEEHARIATLRTLAQEKMNLLSQTILLFQSGYPEAAREMVVSERGRLLMANISKLMDEVARQETSLQTARSATYQSSIGRTITSIYLTTGIVALGLIFLAYYILLQIDIRDRHAQEILEREEWFRSTLTSLGDAVIATDKRGLVTFLNPIAERLMGIKFSQAKGQPVETVFPIFDESTLQPLENSATKVMEGGRPVDSSKDTVLQRSDGHLIPIKDNAAPILDSSDKLVGAVLVFRDATYERQSQELLRKTEKLAASARLAATVSHAVDVPLEAAGDLIYIVKLNEGVPTDASELLTMAERHLERASHITREILGFYRDSTPPDQVDLSILLESVLRTFSNRFREKNIAVERNLQDCPSVNGLSGELNQAIANLVSNSADAVPFGGTIRVELSSLDNANGKAVMISIQDNGPGIAPENRDRIFEPFFTTKKDVGYGLGLWITKGIVERHGGSIQVHFENGASSSGTIFNIFLPVNTGPKSLASAA